MITVFIRRVFPLLAIASAVILLIRMAHVPAMGSDAWLHLRLGDEFRQGWSIAHPGHLGVFDSSKWYPTQWLAQVAMSWTEDQLGLTGVIWMAGTLILALPVFMFVACRRLVAPLPAAVATVLGTCAAAPGLSARPQVASYLLILLVLSAWLTTAHDLKPRYWLVLVAWVWVPLHGMWIVGISIGVAAVIGIGLTKPAMRVVARLAAIPVLSAIVPIFTPLGVHAYDAISGVGDRNAELTEWMPPDFTSPNAIVLAVMITIALVIALRSSPLDWPSVLLLVLAMAWAVFSVRTTIVAGVMLTPLLAMALQRMVPPVPRIRRPELALLMAMLLTASGALWVVVAHRDEPLPAARWMDERLDDMSPGTKILNDWELGHYTLWRHPQLQLVMHGYVDVFTVSELQRNVDIVRLQPGWDAEVDRLDVDYALVDPDSALGYALVHQLEWHELEGDDDYVLLAPPTQ